MLGLSKYLIGGIVIAIALAFSHWKAYSTGMDVQAGIEAQARQDLIALQQEKVKIIYKEKVRVEVKYRDKVKTIYKTVDPTGCLDRTLGDVGLFSTTTDNKTSPGVTGTSPKK